MFPNHYGSKFNSDSYMLGYTEAEMFQSDYSVGCKMLESITIFLDFLGISMSKVDGRLCLASRERLI